jgi:hypothetical protein
MNRNYDGWILVFEGPTGVYRFVGAQSCDPDDLPTEGVGTGSTAMRQDGKTYLYHETGGWKEWS